MDVYFAIYTLAAICALAVVLFIIPIFRVVFALKRANKRLLVVTKNPSGDFVADLFAYPVISNHPRIDGAWKDYLSALKKARIPSTVHIADYFNTDIIVENIPLHSYSDITPIVLSSAGALFTAFFMIGGLYTPAVGLSPNVLYPAAAGVTLSLAFFIINSIAHAFSKRGVLSFLEEVSKFSEDLLVSDTSLLSEIVHLLKDQSGLQTELYNNMAKMTAKSFSDSVIPVLKEIQDRVDGFILAATERQSESMQNLAGEFVKKLHGAYEEKLTRIEGTIDLMVKTQEASVAAFENMHAITSASGENLFNVQKSAENLLLKFDSYFEKLSLMSEALSSNMNAITGAVEYMRNSGEAQSATIARLSEYQSELIGISGLYTETMEKVVRELKDQLVSTMISLRSVSADMLKSGDHLKSAYGEFSNSVVEDVEKVFEQFDKNMGAVSAHLSQRIGDLQETLDELPEVLKAIRTLPQGGGEGI